MPTKLVTIRINRFWIPVNGNFEDETFAKGDKGIKNNALAASLRYPRSGAPNIVAVKQYDLPGGNHDAILFDSSDEDADEYFDKLLFREEVSDRTVLHLAVTKYDSEGKFAKWMSGLFTAILSAGFTAVTGGLGGILGAVAGFGVDSIKSDIKDSPENNDILIADGKLEIKVEDFAAEPREVQILLKVPKDVIRPRLVVVGAKVERKDVTLLHKNDDNGKIWLTISAAPLTSATPLKSTGRRVA